MKGVFDPINEVGLYTEEYWFSNSPSGALVVKEDVPTIVSLEVCDYYKPSLANEYRNARTQIVQR